MTCAPLNIVLYTPEIPHNTGAIGRLVLAVNARLHLIEPLGFSLEEKHLRRSGLDYWQHLDVQRWPNWESFLAGIEEQPRLWFFTTKTDKTHWDAQFKPGDYLVFGPESRGIPELLLAQYPQQCLTIPMPNPQVRSLNLATAAGIALYAALGQLRAH